MFNIHAMMLDDDDFVDAIKDIIQNQMMCAEYAVSTAATTRLLFFAYDDPYLQAAAPTSSTSPGDAGHPEGGGQREPQGTSSILVAAGTWPSETRTQLLLGFITRGSNSHTVILARSMNIPALIQCKDIQGTTGTWQDGRSGRLQRLR